MNYQRSGEGEAKRPNDAFCHIPFLTLLFLAGVVYLGVKCDSSIMQSYVWNVRVVLQQEEQLVLIKGETL